MWPKRTSEWASFCEFFQAPYQSSIFDRVSWGEWSKYRILSQERAWKKEAIILNDNYVSHKLKLN
jgi:hypothetical protein